MKVSTWRKTFSKFLLVVLLLGIVLSSFDTEPVQAASKNKTYYYSTMLNRSKGGCKNGWYSAGTRKVKYTSKSITFYGSFFRNKKKTGLYRTKENFLKYGKRTFKLTPKTKYYWTDIELRIPAKKYDALRCCKSLNGLRLFLKVTNGQVVYMMFFS